MCAHFFLLFFAGSSARRFDLEDMEDETKGAYLCNPDARPFCRRSACCEV